MLLLVSTTSLVTPASVTSEAGVFILRGGCSGVRFALRQLIDLSSQFISLGNGSSGFGVGLGSGLGCDGRGMGFGRGFVAI